MKKCSKCGEIKAFDNFHKSKITKDCLHAWCKDCVRQAQIDRIAKLRGNHTPPENGIKRCTKCNRDLPVSRFYQNAAAKDGLSWNCKSCLGAMNHAVYEKKLGLGRGKATAKTKRQNKVVKYGEAIVEAMEQENSYMTEDDARRLIDGF